MKKETEDAIEPYRLINEEELEEVTYPNEWDINIFKNLPSYKKRIEYAKAKLRQIGVGSSRIVFEIDSDTVLKLARNEKGLMQNELEYEISSINYYDFVTKVYDSDPQNLWIEAEKAKKMTESNFKKLTGFKFKEFVDTLMAEYGRINRKGGMLYQTAQKNYEEILESDFFNNILSFINDYDILPGDFGRVSSWGIVNRDGKEMIVLTDYGISNEIYKNYYAK